MRFRLKWIFLVLAGLLVLEPAVAQSIVPKADKYWIFFRDRGGHDTPARYVPTSDALSRRARRGSPVPLSIDYHVSPAYVAILRDMDVQPIVESRWMNAVSALLTAEQQRSVIGLEFVDHLSPVGRSTQNLSATSRPSTVALEGAPLASPRRTERSLLPTTDASTLPLLEASGPTALDYGASETQLALVNAIPLLEAGINGAGVRLGFLDASFLELDHPALQHLHLDRRVVIRDFTGREQSGSHGLSVISVAAGYAPGELIGPAHGARILGATTEYAPTETNAEEDYFVAGLEWLEAMGADVVSASIGYTTFDPGQNSYAQSDLDGDTGVTTRAADLAASLGITFVVAAGNEGSCSSPSSCWYYVNMPADGDSVIAVGAVTPSLSRSSFSSFGPTADGRMKPDVVALGSSVYIAVPNGEYKFGRGTSFSAPMVAGIAAQMLQVNPSLSPIEVRDILRQTASQAENPDSALGWGIVDAEAAVQVAIALNTDDVPKSATLTAQAYPNPATDYLFIHINARSIDRPNVRLYDVLGRTVDPQAADVRYPSRNLISLETASLSAGVYFYTVEDDEMRTSGTFVVVR